MRVHVFLENGFLRSERAVHVRTNIEKLTTRDAGGKICTNTSLFEKGPGFIHELSPTYVRGTERHR
jgi:hypothetical protein